MNYLTGLWAGACIGAGGILAYFTYLFAWAYKQAGVAPAEKKKKPKKARGKPGTMGGPCERSELPRELYVAWCEEHQAIYRNTIYRVRPAPTDCECIVSILKLEITDVSIPENWVHNMCLLCWNEQRPGKDPVREGKGKGSTCCWCHKENKDGIYVRSNPKSLDCSHK